MFFFLRCFLFLGLVFWSIPPQNPVGGGSVATKQGGTSAGNALATGIKMAKAKGEEFCNHKPALCMDAAARLAGAGKDISPVQILQLARTLGNRAER